MLEPVKYNEKNARCFALMCCTYFFVYVYFGAARENKCQARQAVTVSKLHIQRCVRLKNLLNLHQLNL